MGGIRSARVETVGGFELALLADDGTGSRQATIGYRVYQALKQAIVRAQFKPGHLLSEAEIARQLGVSRQPVREAFIKLAEVGLVDIRPQRGTFVLLISRREVENARFIREAIEVAVVRRAAEMASADDVGQLRDLVAQQAASGDHPDQAHFLSLDDTFHQAIARIVECENAWRVAEDLKVQMDRVRFLSLSNATPVETIIRQHLAIVDAIESGSGDAAEAAMRLHLSEVLHSLPKIADAHAEFFVP
ncbi:GntR family transcriptional regulator [Pelagibacterium limicola]|uniref:GntR family transcriptional regulator n=1 Tax=Pelagibacterium limicola TaxID=2791022 RepID=UPI0018B00533|nr:GntR family transcriptional regulator [Pelagibacterium limicola]